MPWDTVTADFGTLLSSGYSVSLFTTWTGTTVPQLWVKGMADVEPPDLRPARRAGTTVHMIPGMSVSAVTGQLGVVGPWHERLPHFRPSFTPSSGAELQSEYLLPIAHANEAIAGLRARAEQLAPLLQVSEIRTVAADDLWLSGAFGTDVVALHFTWHPDWEGVYARVARARAPAAPPGSSTPLGQVLLRDPDRTRCCLPHVRPLQTAAGSERPCPEVRQRVPRPSCPVTSLGGLAYLGGLLMRAPPSVRSLRGRCRRLDACHAEPCRCSRRRVGSAAGGGRQHPRDRPGQPDHRPGQCRRSGRRDHLRAAPHGAAPLAPAPRSRPSKVPPPADRSRPSPRWATSRWPSSARRRPDSRTRRPGSSSWCGRAMTAGCGTCSPKVSWGRWTTRRTASSSCSPATASTGVRTT